ncbi:uncharacterized protein LACBIDRAFT_192763 [Laccaria bicolor S238N-H82]|uniref:Predicted protein n=1 Tax=Laccaria bicolor (strain S238N-H82 / ATCC MYA-4686) TaxID=486041 RepID=B0DX40_LACBS|nr:uncharacterized protein LACBIDRAFT_192763 [Laccaria bicolor S238N-H82]EDR00926.1 predicted protein [Laccaria bicolor S238N-H82]|eukprot:XP_001888520.1 predicted protein [Laccaria bicolor S238N-H82]
MTRFHFLRSLGAASPFDPAHKLVTSPVISSPFVLAILRLIVAFYTTFALIFSLAWEGTKLGTADSYFSYFTHLSYIGICAYFWASGIQTFSYYRRWRKAGAGVGYLLQRQPGVLRCMHVVLQSTVVTFPILVTIVFWALLSSPSTFETVYSSWDVISVHALNTVFALFEILLTNSPPAPWLTLPFGLFFLAGYLGIAYITHATQGFYSYSFLDPQKQHGKVAAYIVGIAVGEIIIFCLIRGVIVLRERWAIRARLVMVGGSTDENLEDEEWEEIEGPSSPGV